jgi:hypothetical protein
MCATMVPPDSHRCADPRKGADGLPTLTEVLDWRSQAAGLADALPVLRTEAAEPVAPLATDAPGAAVAEPLVDPVRGPGAAPGPAAARLHPLEPALEAAINHAVDAALVRLLHEWKPQLAAALQAAVLQALGPAQQAQEATPPEPPARVEPPAADGAGDAA